MTTTNKQRTNMSSLSSLTHTTCSVLSDSSYTFSSKVASEISEKISDKFREISDYMASHGLKLNGDKTHLMLLMSDESRRAKPKCQALRAEKWLPME